MSDLNLDFNNIIDMKLFKFLKIAEIIAFVEITEIFDNNLAEYLLYF